MPIDRPAILRNAEKLLRQGKIDQAIAEYVRIVEEQPGDWNTANVLGDLYVRAGQAVIVLRGEWVQYSTPEPEGAEYVAICLPAFSPETVHRDEARERA